MANRSQFHKSSSLSIPLLRKEEEKKDSYFSFQNETNYPMSKDFFEYIVGKGDDMNIITFALHVYVLF